MVFPMFWACVHYDELLNYVGTTFSSSIFLTEQTYLFYYNI